jgi:pSer/pThr/pTyr-binding forkhead associated (FHA) protein
MADKETWLIGADPECDLVIDEPRVSRRHCLLVRDGEEFQLEDLNSTNGVYVNGQRLNGRCKVSRADQITLGQATPMPWPLLRRDVTVQAQARPAAPLNRDSHEVAARSRDEQRVIVGRDRACDVSLDYSEISGQHVELNFLADGTVEVCDLGSTNGTLIGNPLRRVNRATISVNESISLGPHQFTPVQLAELAGRGWLTKRDSKSSLGPMIKAGPRERLPASFNGKSKPGQWLWLAGIPAAFALVVLLFFRTPSDSNRANAISKAKSVAEPTAAVEGGNSTTLSSSKKDSFSEGSIKSEPPTVTSGPGLAPGNPSGKEPRLLLQSTLGRVVCCDDKGANPLMVGSCLAIENNLFLTTATVLKLVEDLKTSGFPLVQILPAGKSEPLEVERIWSSSRFHKLDTQIDELLRQQRELTADLEENPDSEEVREKFKRIAIQGVDLINQKVLWDIGFLRVRGKLSEYFPLPQENPKLRPNQELELHVFPIDLRDSYVDFEEPEPPTCLSTRVVLAIEDQTDTPGYFQAVAESQETSVAARALLGGVLLTNRGQPAGVFVRQTPARVADNAATPSQSANSDQATSELEFEFVPISRIRQARGESVD